MAKAHSENMRAEGLYDVVNYPLEQLEYPLLGKIEERTRSYCEDANPENVIDALTRSTGLRALRLSSCNIPRIGNTSSALLTVLGG